LPALAQPNAGASNASAQAAAQAAAQQREANRQFMALSINKKVLAQQANGGALSQPFNPGQPLTFNIPTANNAYLTGYWIRLALTINLATGTGATYASNAAYPLSLIDSIVLNYGGVQHNYRPYMMKYYTQMRGALRQIQPRSVLVGQNDTYLQQYYNSISPTAPAAGANTVNISFFVPTNLIHPQDPRGILPVQNGETTAQITVNCQGSILGVDPTLNSIAIAGGTGGALSSVTGTVSLIAQYKDGQAFGQLTALQPNLSGIETVQFMRDVPLNNLGAGQVFRNKVTYLAKIPWLFVTIIDGNQSNKFTATSNIQILECTADSTGNRPFWRYGQNTNLDVREVFGDLSGAMGGLLQQDMDEGFIPFVYGPIYEQADASILEGQAYLDTTMESGWTDFHYGVQLQNVGSVAGIAPRMEAHLIYLNSPLVQ
jgi:hypothetical protein